MRWLDALAAELSGELETAREGMLAWSRNARHAREERVHAYLHMAQLEERLGAHLEAAEWYAKAGRELLDVDDPLDSEMSDVAHLWSALDAFHTAVVLACANDHVQHAIAQEYLPVFEEAWQFDREALAREAMFAALLCQRLGDPERAAYYFEEAARCLEMEAARNGNLQARSLAEEAWDHCVRAHERLGNTDQAERIRNVQSMATRR